jgi:hypothetical protein
MSKVTKLLGPFAPFAKAIAPFVISAVIAAVNQAASGNTSVTWKVLAGGILAGISAYLVPNKTPAKAKEPTAPPEAPVAPPTPAVAPAEPPKAPKGRARRKPPA